MSWTATTGYSPAILKKPSSTSSIVNSGGGPSGSAHSYQQAFNGAFSSSSVAVVSDSSMSASADEQEVVVPLVLWSEAPRVEISCLHVLQLPLSQPSQNSNTTTTASVYPNSGRRNSISSNSNSASASATIAGLQIQIVDDDDDDEPQYQTCVFAGTVDGAVIYWLLEGDAVVQASLLVFADDTDVSVGIAGNDRRVQGIVSGTDEYGQSMLVTVGRDGRVARWQLPNGQCAHASASLAKQLAPVEGVAMFCNSRYAIVYAQASRMMVLDTWFMTLLYCVDTAQEQIRRSIAVGELKRPSLKTAWPAFAKNPLSPAAGGGTTTGDSGQALTNGSAVGTSSSSVPTPMWDSLVVSLGAEGLVKCFLWSKPRGSSSGAGTSNSSATATFQWRQESCWVLSWADEADDITCSQSTSLKDGDHMNPQTALMRSIKSSYFPLAVRVSPDASLLLFIWATKWAVLKRKWLCRVDPASSKTGSNTNKSKPTVFVGSCNIPPAAFLGQTSSTGPTSTGSTSTGPTTTGRIEHLPAVAWASGEFVGDSHVLLWTTTGHVFQFAACGRSMGAAGKLFLFTKDTDQFVPRSNFKRLTAIERGQFIAYTKQCTCCATAPAASSLKSAGQRARLMAHSELDTSAAAAAGFTACVQSAAGAFNASSPLTPSLAQTTLVHMCRRGSFGLWTIALHRSASPPRMTKSLALPVHLYDRVPFHAFADGFAAMAQTASSTSSTASTGDRESRRLCLSHLLLGRDESGATCSFAELQRMGRRRRRAPASTSTNSNSVDSSATHALSSTRASPMPLTKLRGTIATTNITSTSASIVDAASQYLLDVPVALYGFSDGSVEIALLGRTQSATSSSARTGSSLVHLACHNGSVTAVAHCVWPAPDASANDAESAPLPPSSHARSTTTAASSSSNSSSAVQIGKKARTWKRGMSVEDSILASDKNPFFRSRFPAPAQQRRSWSSRHFNVSASGASGATSATTSASAPCSPNTSTATSATSATSAIYFMVFTGGADGAMRVIELALRPVDATFVCDATVLQRFRKHRGAIQDIAVSPVRDRNSTWSAQAPDRLVATIGVDRKVTLFAPVYSYHPMTNNRTSALKSRCAVEWECVFELSEHNDAVCGLEWHLERGLLYVECADRMVAVWNTDTGILERIVPIALLSDDSNTNSAITAAASDASDLAAQPSVECTELGIGDTSVRLLQFRVIRSAERIKRSWKSYFIGMSAAPPPLLLQSSSSSRTVSPYAIGSIELLLLSFLLSWGATPEIDRACRELLGLDAPELLFSCALRDGVSGALTIPVPWLTVGATTSASRRRESAFVRNWQHSAALSANLALGIVSLCMNLMEHKYSKPSNTNAILPSSPSNKEEFHVLWSQLITQHSVVLPDYVPGFREPALEHLARFGFHACDYTQLAARALLSGVIKRLAPLARSALTAEYATKLHCEIVRLESETGSKLNGSAPVHATNDTTALVVARLGSLVILLSMIGTCFPGEISPASAREVGDILVFLLKAPAQHVGSVAAELLTKGLALFRPHLVDLSSLIVQLLLLDMRAKMIQQKSETDSDSPVFGSHARVLAHGGSNASLSLLVELGACETAFVLALLQQEMHNNERPHAFRECVLLYLSELLSTHYLLMFRHLPAVVDTIMCCLDPTKLERRKRCLELSTRCLHGLVRRFPMVDFHKETQRLAIGTMEAVILIYDLRTATKWRVLDGHTSAVSAAAFRPDGQILVSYAAREGSVRWWNSGNAGLFGGMLKMQQSCLKEHKLEALKSSAASAPAASGGASGDLKQVIQTCRFQFLTLREPPTTGSNADGKDKRILRLTREDASQVQFLL